MSFNVESVAERVDGSVSSSDPALLETSGNIARAVAEVTGVDVLDAGDDVAVVRGEVEVTIERNVEEDIVFDILSFTVSSSSGSERVSVGDMDDIDQVCRAVLEQLGLWDGGW